MDFEVGEEYSRLEVAREFGFNDDRQSTRGGIFHRNDKVLLLKTEDKQTYEDRWDPTNLGTLTYFASTKGYHINKNNHTIDLPIDSGANREFVDGTCPIILFSISGDSYRYMGEFERSHLVTEHIVRNGYYVPGFQIKSKNPELITPYISDYLDNVNAKNHWTPNQIKSFSRMYIHEEISLEDIREMAITLNKSVTMITDVINSVRGKGDPSSVSEKTIASIRREISKNDEYEKKCLGYEIEVKGKARVNQKIFRSKLDEIFKNKCCLTGINKRETLIASHVLPWSMSDPFQKINPNNGLLLNTFHDALFGKYLMTVRTDGTVEYLDSLEESLGKGIYRHMCAPYTEISFPAEYHPSKESFDFHNKEFDKLCEIEGRS